MTDRRSEFWCYEPHEIKYELLDPGIREVVRFLVAQGFHTTDSGDGESKRAKGWTDEDGLIPFPHVIIQVKPSEIAAACWDLIGVLRGVGVEVVSQTEAWAEVLQREREQPRPYVEATYDPVEDVATVALYHVTSEMITRARGAA